MTQTAQKPASQADDGKKAPSAPAATPAAAPDASGSHAGTVTIKAAEAALMLGETAAYHSIRSGADEIATWINTASDLEAGDRILIVEGGSPWDDSVAHAALGDELNRVTIDARRRFFANEAILNPQPSEADRDGLVPPAETKPPEGQIDKGLPGAGVSPVADLLASVASLADPLKTAVGVLSSANTAVGYFRADHAIASARTNPNDDALRAMLAEKITRCEVFLFSGATFAPAADNLDLISSMGVLYRLAHKTLAAQRDQLAALHGTSLATALGILKAGLAMAEAERAELKAHLASLEKQLITSAGNTAATEALNKMIAADKVKDAELENRIGTHKKACAQIISAQEAPQAAIDATDAIVKRIDAFLDSVSDGGKGAANFTRALRHEWVTRLGITHLLQASCVSAGHETLTEQGPIYRVAQMQRLYLLGSSVVSYALTRVNGLKVKTDTLARASRMAIKLSDGSIADIESLKVA